MTEKTAKDIKKDYYYCDQIKRENKDLKSNIEDLGRKIINQKFIIVQKDTIISKYREEVSLSEQQTQLYKDQSKKRSKSLTYSVVGNVALAILLFFAVK